MQNRTLTLTDDQIEILKAAIKASTVDSVLSFVPSSMRRPDVIRLRGSVMLALDHASGENPNA